MTFLAEEEKQVTESFESYSELDSLGRCGVAYANIGIDLFPTEERESISKVKPTGWHSYRFNDTVSGGYLYNRCHLLAFSLAGENANEKNLITGTRYFNIYGMKTFEDPIRAYVEETENHVLMRVTPFFEGNDLLCKGVEIEAWSVEDEGQDICFNVFCYNVQPKVILDYKTGKAKEVFKNVLLKREVKERAVFYGRERIGDRAFLTLSEKKFNKVKDSDLVEFCEKVVKEYEQKDFNYFTIDFENNRGAVFPSCTYFPIEVGEINENGEITRIEKYIYVSDEGEVEQYTKDLELLEAEGLEKSQITRDLPDNPENGYTVYVSESGKYHSKSNCSGMKRYTTMTLGEAIAYGYDACKKCYR